MQTIYSYSGDNVVEFRQSYGEVVRQEYYDGELEIEDSGSIDVIVQKALAYPMSLLRVRSRSGISFRRTWNHIRKNKIGAHTLWIVREGTLRIARTHNSCEVKAGQCAILDTNAPFHARAIADDGGSFDAVQAIVPAHLFLSHLPMAREFHSTFELDSADTQVAAKLLDLLSGEGEQISRRAVEPLVAAFLEAISDKISLQAHYAPRQRVVDKRLADIEAYIVKNLTNPDLSYDMVATKCGISARYLCYLLKMNNTSFSRILWGQRLSKAREWLVSEAMQDYPVFEIGFMAGFKSAAHFSRMFKAACGYSPKQYRSVMLADRADDKQLA